MFLCTVRTSYKRKEALFSSGKSTRKEVSLNGISEAGYPTESETRDTILNSKILLLET